jgi:hypothetical protein
MSFHLKIGVFDHTNLIISSFAWIRLSYNFDILLLAYRTKNLTKIHGLQSYAKFVIHQQTKNYDDFY